jgi:hypothetical protein
LTDIISLFVKSEDLNNVVSPLHTESVGACNVGNTFDFLLALLNNAELDGSDIGTVDASTDGLSLALTSAGGLVVSGTYSI